VRSSEEAGRATATVSAWYPGNVTVFDVRRREKKASLLSALGRRPVVRRRCCAPSARYMIAPLHLGTRRAVLIAADEAFPPRYGTLYC